MLMRPNGVITKYANITGQFFHFAGFTAVFLWQHLLWYKFIQGLKIAVEVDTLANLLFEEWTNEIDNGIY